MQALPGIGRYTAGAVLSIAFDQCEPILEANTVRLLSRLLAFRGDPRSTAGQTQLWNTAEAWLPRRGAGDFNQALMELGSLICTPRQPDCPACPLAQLCPAQAGGWQGEIPRAAARPRWEEVHEATVAVRQRGRVLLIRQPGAKRWAGLWGFPRFGLDPAPPSTREAALAAGVRQLTGLVVAPRTHLITLKHGVTRFRITLECFLADYQWRGEPTPKGTELAWVAPRELDGYALSSTGRKLAKLLMHQAD